MKKSKDVALALAFVYSIYNYLYKTNPEVRELLDEFVKKKVNQLKRDNNVTSK